MQKNYKDLHKKTIEKFADEHEILLKMERRPKSFPDDSRFCVTFNNTKIKKDQNLISAFGNGTTLAQAITDYAKKISLQEVVRELTKQKVELSVAEIELPINKEEVNGEEKELTGEEKIIKAIEDFADKHDLILDIGRRPRLIGSTKFYAFLRNTEIGHGFVGVDGGLISGMDIFGNGATPEEAIIDYAKQISFQKIVFNGSELPNFICPTN